MIAYQFRKHPKQRAPAKLRQRILPLMFAVAFGTLGGYLLIRAHAATTEQPSVSWSYGSSELANANSGLCLGTSGNSQPAVGATIIIEGCSAINSEKWTLTWGGSTVKSTTIVNGYGQCLDDRGGNAGVGVTVKIYTCTANNTAQIWTTGYGDGTIRIDGLCLGVSGNSRSAGSNAILTPCNTPVPSVQITSPGAGSTVSGTATMTASASISQDSIAKITLEVGGSVLGACMNASSCSANWNTTSSGNGSYTLTAVATGALGGTATATETVHVSNASPSPPASSGGGSSSSGSGSSSSGDSGNGGSGSTGGADTSGGGSSISDSNTDDTATSDSGTFTCDPSDPTCSGSTVSVCDPSDPTCSSDVSLCDPSDPTCDSSTSTDTTDGTDSGSASTGSGQSGSKSSSGSKTLNSGKSSVKSVLGIIFSSLALIIIGVGVFIYRKRSKDASYQPAYDPDEFFASIAPPAAAPVADYQPTIASPHEIPIPEHSVANVALPTENNADTEARVHWWDVKADQHPTQPANPTPANEPPDMFEEGRQRLEREEQEGRFRS